MDFLDHTLEDFREYLKENTESKNTVKNYVSDLRIFLIFLDSRHAPITAENFPHLLKNDILQEFSNYLSVINPPATLNRRVSSVKKFFDYYLEHHPLPIAETPKPPSVPEPEPTPAIPEIEIPIEHPTETIPIAPEPELAPVPESPPPPVAETNQLLRLLPEEITEEEETPTVRDRPTDSPANFIQTYKVHIICTISFALGFLTTMAIYPLLYP